MSSWRRRQMLAAGGKEEPFVWPDTLQKVAYISSPNGGLYVDTNIVAYNKVLDFDFAFLSDYDDKQLAGVNRYLQAAKFEGKLYYHVGSGTEYNAAFPNGFDYNFHHYVLSTLGKFTYDSTTIYDTAHTPGSSDRNIFIFLRNRNDPAGGDVRYAVSGSFQNFKIYDTAGKMYFDGVPVRTLDSWVNAEGNTVPTGTVGFFDMVSKKLFTEYYDNNFTAGPDITD